MGVINWRGLPVVAGSELAGLTYFCTVRMPSGLGPMPLWPDAPRLGASVAPFDSFNLGDHVGDDVRAVQANRERLESLLPTAPVWLNQVHGTDVFDADIERPQGPPLKLADATETGPFKCAPPQADAAITAVPGRVLCIMTADCLPVLLSDSSSTVLGLAHAGWRGLAAGVLDKTLAALRQRAPAASSWRAWIGPAIGQAAFEVGSEVRRAFIEQDAGAASYFAPGQPERWQADLAGLAARRLQRAGVNHIDISGLCTHARADLFYSYRRDGATGRMATVAWLDSAN